MNHEYSEDEKVKMMQAKQLGLVLCVGWTMCASQAFAQDVIDAEEVGEATRSDMQDRAGQVPNTAGEAAEGGEEVTSGGEAVDVTPGSKAPPAAQSGEPVIGPGGRPLRTDYPGTEESLRERMETDRIQGIASGDSSSKEVYDLRVQELETRISDLKDQVFRSKSRIVLLKETLTGNKLAGSKVIITQKSELKSFKLKKMIVQLDGTTVRQELDRDGSLSDKESIEIYNGPLGPGTHSVVMQLEYQGVGKVFNYFDGYTTPLQKECKFTVEEGMVTAIDLVAYKEGNATTRSDQAAALKCDIQKSTLVEEK